MCRAGTLILLGGTLIFWRYFTHLGGLFLSVKHHSARLAKSAESTPAPGNRPRLASLAKTHHTRRTRRVLGKTRHLDPKTGIFNIFLYFLGFQMGFFSRESEVLSLEMCINIVLSHSTHLQEIWKRVE